MGTANDALLAAIVRHQVDVLRFSKGEARAVDKMLKAAEDDLVQRLAARAEKGLSAHGTERLEELLKSVREERAKAIKAAGGRMKSGLGGLAEHEAGFEDAAIKGSLPFELQLAKVPAETLRALVNSPVRGATVDGWLDNMTKADVGRVEAAVRRAAIEGQTPAQLTSALRNDLGVTRRNAEALGRTAINHVSNRAREEVWKANSDIVGALRWTSTLDGRTTPVCQDRDGELAPVGSSPLPAGSDPLEPPDARPPAHFNCRSVMVPVIDGQAAVGQRPFVRDSRTPKERQADFRQDAAAKAGDAWKTMSAAQRNDAVRVERDAWTAANVGRVPAKVTYEGWLRKQPKSFQNEVLGRAKADMFRAGSPLGAFVDASGKELSLAQLKAEGVGQTLNVVQPGVGLKAKAYLQMGMDADIVLNKLKMEFPDATPTAASVASYKSELKKAGLLGLNPPAPGPAIKSQGLSVAQAADWFHANLPEGLKKAVTGGAWYKVADDLSGGHYAHYKSGLGVELSAKKLSALPAQQVRQILAHELGHMLNKQYALPGFSGLEGTPSFAVSKAALSPKALKDYSYYVSSYDELTAEVYAQALSPSAVTSQGIVASEFTQAFAPHIAAAKAAIASKFPASIPPVATGHPIAGTGLVVGSPKQLGVTGYVQQLLKQNMNADDILAAVKAEFPDAKTTKASIASVKSNLKKAGGLGSPSSGPVIHSTKAAPSPPPATVAPAAQKLMTAKEHAQQMGFLDPDGGAKSNNQYAQKKWANQVALKMAQGGLGNQAIAEQLGPLFPLAKTNAKNVASWKMTWKKNGLLSKSAQQSSAAADVAAPAGMEPPTLSADQLGPHSKKGLIQAEQMFAQGSTKQQVEQFLANHFGSYDATKGQPLLYLAEYNAKAKKFTTSAAAHAVHAKPSPAAQAAPDYPKVDMTPTRPATTPYDSWPPPPRFTEQQRAEGIRRTLGSGPSGGAKLTDLNTHLKAEGLEPLTPSEYTVINRYTGSAYSTLNGLLQSGKFANDLHLQATVDAAQSGLRKMASSSRFRMRGAVNRGTTMSSGEFERFKKMHFVGGTVEEHRFTSSSTAYGFSGKIRYKIHSKTGVKVRSISQHPGEEEVLFMPGVRFRVDVLEIKSDGTTYVEYTELTDLP